jgi:hypothetical protein
MFLTDIVTGEPIKEVDVRNKPMVIACVLVATSSTDPARAPNVVAGPTFS